MKGFQAITSFIWKTITKFSVIAQIEFTTYKFKIFMNKSCTFLHRLTWGEGKPYD